METNETVRVALVGCGGMGRHHLETIRRLDGFQIAGLCDVMPETLKKVGEQYDVRAAFTDYEALYDDVRPDFVVVATQTRGHYAPTMAALRRGISVLCEKPIAIDLCEADAMVNAARESGAKLAVHQQNHLHPGILKALELVREGLIGELVVVRGRNKAGRQSGNEFTEMGTHVADMMLRFGGAPEWCSGTVLYKSRLATVADVMEAKQMSPGDRDSGLVAGSRAVADYGFGSGALGELRFTDYRQTMSANYGVDLLGAEGQLAVRVGGGNLAESLWHLARPMEGSPGQLADWKAVPLERVVEPMVGMYRGMAEAIRADGVPPCDGVAGRSALEMILAIYASHKEEGRRVPLPLAERRHPLEVWRTESA
jgi:predicted dehydrogenase